MVNSKHVCVVTTGSLSGLERERRGRRALEDRGGSDFSERPYVEAPFTRRCKRLKVSIISPLSRGQGPLEELSYPSPAIPCFPDAVVGFHVLFISPYPSQAFARSQALASGTALSPNSPSPMGGGTGPGYAMAPPNWSGRALDWRDGQTSQPWPPPDLPLSLPPPSTAPRHLPGLSAPSSSGAWAPPRDPPREEAQTSTLHPFSRASSSSRIFWIESCGAKSAAAETRAPPYPAPPRERPAPPFKVPPQVGDQLMLSLSEGRTGWSLEVHALAGEGRLDVVKMRRVV